MSSLETQRRWNGLCAGQAGVVRAAVQRGSKDLTACQPGREEGGGEARAWWLWRSGTECRDPALEQSLPGGGWAGGHFLEEGQYKEFGEAY